MTDDSFTGIFDDITPDDFNRTTSAVYEGPLALPDDAFERFLHEHLTAVRVAYAAADGAINSVAVLANTTTQRIFAPQDDERVRDYARRLATEAKAMGACWLFISNKTMVGTVLVGSLDKQVTEVYADDKSALNVADEMGSTKQAVYWYAERRDTPEPTRQHGFLEIVASDQLGAVVHGELDQPIKAYGSILGPVS